MKLVGTTKPTIQAIRDRTHWNSSNIKPVDPVSLGLCSQLDLDFAVQKAARKLARTAPTEPVSTLLSAEETTGQTATPSPEPIANEAVFAERPETEPVEEEPEYDADSVFAKLKALKGDDSDAGDDDA